MAFSAALARAVVEAHSPAALLRSDRWRMRAFTLVFPRLGKILSVDEASSRASATKSRRMTLC